MSSRVKNITRLTVGVTGAMLLAHTFTWDISFLAPLFVLMLLQSPSIDVKQASGFVLVICAAGFVGLLLTMTVVHYPVVCLLVIGAALFLLNYGAAKGLSTMLVLMLSIGLTIVPILGMISNAIAIVLVTALLINGIVAVLIALFLFYLLPADTDHQQAVVTVSEKPFFDAAVTTVILFPIVVIFFTFSLTEALVVLTFSIILLNQPGTDPSVRGALAVIGANTLGGLAAILIFASLVAVPHLFFFLLLTVLMSITFGYFIFSDREIAPLFGMAFNTALILLGNSLTDTGTDAFSEFLNRIVQLMIACTYIVVAWWAVNTRFWRAFSITKRATAS